jgi:hypothetical protein
MATTLRRRPTTRRARSAAPRRTSGPKPSGPSLAFVINMVPKSLSGETSQDSEPHLTVNTAKPKQIVGTAFTPDPAGGPRAPIYISANGGLTWKLNSILPSVAGSIGTADITTGFSGKSSRLYAGILNAGNIHLQFLRTLDPFTTTPMTILADRANADQPFTLATKKGAKEHVYIGDNDFNAPGGKTSTLDESLNAGATTPTFTSVRDEKRTTLGQDGPQSRPTAHKDGTVYAAFYRWRSSSGSFPANTLVITSADVVVVRDDNFGGGSPPFNALVDPGDLVVGKRVVTGVSFPFMIHGTAATGQQRLGGSISVAVDPRHSSIVYLVYADRQPGSVQTLHVRVSKDRGLTWSGDCLSVPNATNAAIAVTKNGVIGFLYQQIKGTGASQRWETHLRRSKDGVNWSDLVLSNTPATSPVKTFDPYLGDYDHLVADRKDFCGVFCANNTPDLSNFPNGVIYQRNANFITRQLLKLDGTTVVAPSIDPFFLRVRA